MSSIGETLKKAREEKKITLLEAQRGTKIQLKALINIEEDAFDKLPNPTYAKGFIKQYAQYLAIDPEPLLNEFLSLDKAVAPPQEIKVMSEDEKMKSKPPAKKKPNTNIMILAAIIVVLLAGFGLTKIIGKITPAPAGEGKQEAPLAKKVKKEKPKALLVKENEMLKLTAKANQDSWMHIKCDGKIVYQNILKAGSSNSWQAKDEILLWVGNAAGLELDLNGHSLGSPGRGVMKNILITHEGMKLPEK